jgi:hypothetical protein
VTAARESDGDHGAAIVAALFRGEDSSEADAGSMLVAEALLDIAKLRATFVKES